jgi:hypothetical protein
MFHFSAQFVVSITKALTKASRLWQDGISEEKTESLRISLGGASALTGHRQDARLVRIDAARRAASFEFGLRPCR